MVSIRKDQGPEMRLSVNTDVGREVRAVLFPVRQRVAPLGYSNSRVNVFYLVLWIIETLL